MTAVEGRAARTFRSVGSKRTAYWVAVEHVDAERVGLFESTEEGAG